MLLRSIHPRKTSNGFEKGIRRCKLYCCRGLAGDLCNLFSVWFRLGDASVDCVVLVRVYYVLFTRGYPLMKTVYVQTPDGKRKKTYIYHSMYYGMIAASMIGVVGLGIGYMISKWRTNE